MNKYLKKAENSSGIDHYVRVPGTGAKQKITFTKMHGCANDYVYIDCFQNDIQNYAELAIYLSDRHTARLWRNGCRTVISASAQTV